MNEHEQVPEGVPPDRPNAARMYDYFLGGHHNFAIDRKAAEQVLALWPETPQVMAANRAFLRRAVRFLVAQGVDQFLDVGSGIPTVGNVHAVAQEANPAARVVYVDIDPIAVADGRAILRDTTGATVIQGDVRQPEQILSHPEVARLLDLRRPLGLLVVAVLHFVVDDAAAYGAVRALRDAVAPGSYLAITHGSEEGMPVPRAGQEAVRQVYGRTPTPLHSRSWGEVARFFEGFELVEPGLVRTPLWRPEGPDDLFLAEPERSLAYAGVGRKP